MGTQGTELIQQLMDGEINAATSETISRVRDEVSRAMLELIDHGCRIRPLMVNAEHVGFVRGVHTSERRMLFTWFPTPQDRIFHLIRLGTTLTPAEVESLDGHETQTVLRVIDQCTDADSSLLPYLTAFTTTSASEVLWYSRGAACTSFSERKVRIPDGSEFTLIAPPEHSRLWATLSAFRSKSKENLDAAYNAAMITRALAGKGADRIFTSLKKTAKALMSDSPSPWAEVVKLDLKDVNFSDGWGHAHQDDSIEGLLRENEGIEKMDKHEQAMNVIYKKQADEARARAELTEKRLQRALAFQGVEDNVVFLSDVDVQDLDHRSTMLQGRLNEAASSAMGVTATEDLEKDLQRRLPHLG